MGADRTTSESQLRPKATPEETELNRLDLDVRRATQEGLIDVQQQGLDLAGLLLRGQELPGSLASLSGGLSEDVISDISRKAVSDISPGLQAQGILQSGIGASVQGRVAGDVRRGAAEFNLGNQLNLLNLALSGQAQVQSPSLGIGASLGSRLSGLRTINQSQTVTGMNPFFKAFQQSAGSSLGKTITGGRSISIGKFGVGGT